MVYCGRPSKSCGNCRAKKLRCDYAEPTCGQCRRAKRKCAGYRNQLDLTFRDQTQGVISRLGGLDAAKKTAVTDTPRSDERAILIQTSNFPRDPSVTPMLDSVALKVFFDQYVSPIFCPQDVLSGCCPGTLAGSPPSSTEMLSEAVAALGLIPLSCLQRDKQVMRVARLRYASALRLTNTALSHPVQALSDATLLTIMLLASFEAITATNAKSMHSWNIHLEGGCRLLLLRGEEQFQTELGMRLFHSMRVGLHTSHLWGSRAIPPELAILSRQCQAYQTHLPLKLAASKLSEIVSDLSSLRHRTIGQPRGAYPAAEILTTLIDLDDRLGAWVSTIPPEFAKWSVPCEEPSGNVFGSYFDVYDNGEAATILNSFRCVRAMVNDYILKGINSTSSPSPALEYRRDISAALVRDACNDVCATVPYLVDSRRSANDTGITPTIATGNTVMWALCVVADGSYTSVPGLSAWCCTQLHRIWETTGIQQAKSMAELIERGIDIRQWA